MSPRYAAVLLAVATVAAGCGGGGEELASSEPLLTSSVAAETGPPPEPPPPAIVVRVEKGHPIGPGSKGDHVAALQEALDLLGYEVGPVDGAYGPRTHDAIVAFQKKHKLRADGLVGAKTAKAINAELEAGVG